MPQRYYISSSSMNALKLTVFMLVMIVALSTLIDAMPWRPVNSDCCEYFHDNYKLIKEYIHSIISISQWLPCPLAIWNLLFEMAILLNLVKSMIVALSTIVDAYNGGYGGYDNGSCSEYFHDNYKLIEEYIHSIITMFILAK